MNPFVRKNIYLCGAVAVGSDAGNRPLVGHLWMQTDSEAARTFLALFVNYYVYVCEFFHRVLQ